ncbi:MAG: PadR family transcriptional regulator [Planctomycetes bacterium]|nr:PadR family transcriptional regulator [Planctomycetota bacterium]
MNVWITQLRKGLLEFCVLSLLAKGENYGYEIVANLKNIEVLAITESTVYPILTRLCKDGYLKFRLAASPQGPPRRYFSLTVLGRHRVREMGEYWDDLKVSIERLRGTNSEGGK